MNRILQVFAALLFAIAIARPASTQVNSSGKSSGIDVSGMDRSVRPQDDFFRFVNGKWNDKTAIPADMSSYGSFATLRDKSQEALKEIIEEAATQQNPPRGSNMQKVGDLYRSFMDTASIEALS